MILFQDGKLRFEFRYLLIPIGKSTVQTLQLHVVLHLVLLDLHRQCGAFVVHVSESRNGLSSEYQANHVEKLPGGLRIVGVHHHALAWLFLFLVAERYRSGWVRSFLIFFVAIADKVVANYFAYLYAVLHRLARA